MLLMHGSIFTPVDLKQRVFRKVPRPPLRERLMVTARSGNSAATNQVARQVRLQDLAVEGAPFAQLAIDALGYLTLANQPARKLLDIRAGDIGRPLRDLEVSYRPVDLRTPIDQTFHAAGRLPSPASHTRRTMALFAASTCRSRRCSTRQVRCLGPA